MHKHNTKYLNTTVTAVKARTETYFTMYPATSDHKMSELGYAYWNTKPS